MFMGFIFCYQYYLVDDSVRNLIRWSDMAVSSVQLNQVETLLLKNIANQCIWVISD